MYKNVIIFKENKDKSKNKFFFFDFKIIKTCTYETFNDLMMKNK